MKIRLHAERWEIVNVTPVGDICWTSKSPNAKYRATILITKQNVCVHHWYSGYTAVLSEVSMRNAERHRNKFTHQGPLLGGSSTFFDAGIQGRVDMLCGKKNQIMRDLRQKNHSNATLIQSLYFLHSNCSAAQSYHHAPSQALYLVFVKTTLRMYTTSPTFLGLGDARRNNDGQIYVFDKHTYVHKY